jgi:ribonuclease H / adenosylcobalamin/alpha-ribazole phosphatase
VRFIVEADGGSRGNPGPAAYGALVRDAESGEVLVERAEHIGIASNNVAEYRGLIAALTAARELDPHAHVHARLDSKLIVEQMSGRWKIKHENIRPLALQARQILPASQVTYEWVPREQNQHADRLANEALDAAARGEKWSESTSTAALDLGGSQPPQLGLDAATDADAGPPTNAVVGWDVGLGVPTTTLLLRHGETAHTTEKRFSGSGGDDPPLTRSGEAQARAAAALLEGRGAVAVARSPLRHAEQTAAIVAHILGLTVRVVDDLAECAFGEWEGHTFAEVQEKWPDQLTAWLASTAVAPPGGESFDHLGSRVRRARDQLLVRYPREAVLVVSHVSPIKVLVSDALHAPPAAMYRMELSPASVSEIQWYAEGAASLRSFNEVARG